MTMLYYNLAPETAPIVRPYLDELSPIDVPKDKLIDSLQSFMGKVCWVGDLATLEKTPLWNLYAAPDHHQLSDIKELWVLLGDNPEQEEWLLLEEPTSMMEAFHKTLILMVADDATQAAQITRHTPYLAVTTAVLEEMGDPFDINLVEYAIIPRKLLPDELCFYSEMVECIDEVEILDPPKDFDYLAHYSETYGEAIRDSCTEMEAIIYDLDHITMANACELPDVRELLSGQIDINEMMGKEEVIHILVWISPRLFDRLPAAVALSILNHPVNNPLPTTTKDVTDAQPRTDLN